MEGQDGQRKSPPGNSQFSQHQQSAGLSPAFDQGVSPTATGQYGFADGNSYMNNLQAQSFNQPDLGGDYQSAELEYRRRSMSNQTASDLNSPFNPNFNQSYGNQGDGGLMLDPSLQSIGQPQRGSINPADLMNNMSPSQEQAPSPGGLSPSSQRSPSIQQASFYSPNHSRHTSLDPSSAAAMGAPPPGQDWSGMLSGPAFSQHRRAPSEHSDISSISPSPYVKQDGFDFEQGRSPMLNPQADTGIYPENLGIERFSISDPSQQGVSPRHSPIPSPRMSPHAGLGIPENHFILPSNDGNQFNGPPVFAGGQNPSPGMGGMAPPEINVEFAPSQNIDLNRNGGDLDGLSPPDRGRRGARMRAHSDPAFAPMSRPLSPGETSPNLLSIDANQRRRSLSPLDSNGAGSRDLSPGGKGSRRSSTSSIPNREYILDLADPTRPTASGDGSGRQARVQKHPATFQCTLCPKRFTRAYNLRSHLRTHTDERPFVCTVCGKAFARQHDRKRHEGLHSGEKKFVCKGDLAHGGGSWGCGRRFARADALGRHFRSEAGRVCIKPLLEEEAAERQRQYQESMMASGQAMAIPGGMGGGLQPQTQTMEMANGFTLPAALLAQYPALQGLQWDQLGAPNPADEVDARSSFDASSGGEYDDYEDPNGGYVSGPGTAYGTAW